MCSRYWRKALSRPDRPTRIAVVGVGNELYGDDAIGVYIARRLSASSNLLVVDACPVPERCTGPLRRFTPDLVILVDAVSMSQPPGTIRYFAEWHAADSAPATHSLPLDLLRVYLHAELGCNVTLLGIQPETDADYLARLRERAREKASRSAAVNPRAPAIRRSRV